MEKIKNKYNFSKLDLMIEFIPITKAKDKKAYYNLKKWLHKKLKRTLTPQEEINLVEGIIELIKSDAATNERAKSMSYLFNAEFLND